MRKKERGEEFKGERETTGIGKGQMDWLNDQKALEGRAPADRLH